MYTNLTASLKQHNIKTETFVTHTYDGKLDWSILTKNGNLWRENWYVEELCAKLYNIPTLGSVMSTLTCYTSQYWNKEADKH